MTPSLEEAQAEVARLSDEGARLHQLIGRHELELDTAREQQSQGVRTASDWAVSLVKTLADLRARRDQNDQALTRPPLFD